MRKQITNQKNLKLTQAAFTLLELLIIIAIIGLLASFILVALGSAKTKARNAKRVQDVHQIMTALALYYEDNNFTFPNGGSVGNKDKESDIQNLASFLIPKYMGMLPNDPTKSGENYEYAWNNNGQDYGIRIPYSNDGGIDCQMDTPNADNSKWWKITGNPIPICP